MPIEASASLSELVDRVAAAFETRFGRAPSVLAAAPGRVNLIGEHTDYNDGLVLPMAIERYVVVAADKADRDAVTVHSVTMDSDESVSVEGKIADNAASWANYIGSVLGVYHDEGLPPCPMDVAIDSTVPLGGGLSSSAALEVGFSTAIEAIMGYEVDAQRKALLCQAAEHRAGTPCGIMDQFSSALCVEGHAMLLDCRDQTTKMIPLADPEVVVLISNSNVKHELTGGKYAERREQCEAAAAALNVASLREVKADQVLASTLEGALLKRARHVVTEIERTVRAAECMTLGDWRECGELMYQSHASLRDDFEVSCKELDILVDAAAGIGLDGGVYGSRMTGGGFGGCTVSLVDRSKAQDVAQRIADEYAQKSGLTATQFLTRPARGAHVVE